MNLSYRRDKDHNYMVLDAPGKLTGTEYQVRMIVSNQIPHLLKCNMRMMDGKAVFFYEITGMQPMFRTFEKTSLNQEDIIGILLDMKKALENAQRYLLDGNQIVFEPECMFFDIQTRKWYLCYLPSYDGSMADGFRRLSEYILKKLDHSDEQAVLLGYDVYSKASEENYCLSEVLQVVYQNRKKQISMEKDPDHQEEEMCSTDRCGKMSDPKPVCREGEEAKREDSDCEEWTEEIYLEEENADSRTSENMGNRKLTVTSENMDKGKTKKEPRQEARKAEKKRKEKSRIIRYLLYGCFVAAVLVTAAALVYFGMLNTIQAGGVLFLAAGIFIYFTSIKAEDIQRWLYKRKQHDMPDDFEEEQGTCVLREGEGICMAMLISVRPEKFQNVLLYKEEMHIGKEERQADICLPFEVISRIHAKVIRKEGSYYLMDLASTNGTYINGKRLPAEETVKLEQGDMVAFANVEYIFQMQS